MGRRKKLPELERLDGNPTKRAIIDSLVQAYGEPFVPEHLMDDARGCLEVIKRSMPSRVYAGLDSFLLSAFAMAWAVHKRAAIEISNPEFAWIVLNSAGSQTPSPWLKILNEEAVKMASLGDRLGLDPKSRAALKVAAPGKEKSKFDGLIGQSVSSHSLNA